MVKKYLSSTINIFINQKLFTNFFYGMLDQVSSSLLLFGVNLYFARLSYFNEIGILALVISSIGIANIFQQSILEKPLLIKKNIISLNVLLKRFLIVSVVLLSNTAFLYLSSTSFGLSSLFLIPWIFLGFTQLLFNLLRFYFYSIEKQLLAFKMSSYSLALIFISIVLIEVFLTFKLSYIILAISSLKSFVLIYFLKYVRKPDKGELTTDTSYLQYFFLILISSSMFIKQKLPILFLSTYAFAVVGVYEVIRSITEIVLMPFRPISETLLTYFAKADEIKERLKIIFLFIGVGLLISSIFSLILEFIFEIFNISEIYTNNFSVIIFFFIFATIILVPVNSILLSTKLYKYELTVKIVPVVFFTFALYFFKNYDIQTIYTYIAITTWFELIIAISILVYKRYDIRKTKDNPFV